jgi:hypothetical protein
MRTPSFTTATSRGVPFRVIECTCSVIASMKVLAPGVAVKRTVVVLPNVAGPRVRSSSTSYDWTSTIAFRSCASIRVRFSPGTTAPFLVAERHVIV